MKRVTLKKRSVPIILILILILSAGYMYFEYVRLPYATLNPRVSKEDIIYAEDLLLEIESLNIYSTNVYEEKEINGQEVSQIKDIEEVKSSNIDYVVVEDNIIKEKFHKAKYRPKFTVWKGDTLGIATLTNGDEMIVRISDYGEFFAIQGVEGFYEFDKT